MRVIVAFFDVVDVIVADKTIGPAEDCPSATAGRNFKSLHQNGKRL
jgi:hypothetical protein